MKWTSTKFCFVTCLIAHVFTLPSFSLIADSLTFLAASSAVGVDGLTPLRTGRRAAARPHHGQESTRLVVVIANRCEVYCFSSYLIVYKAKKKTSKSIWSASKANDVEFSSWGAAARFQARKSVDPADARCKFVNRLKASCNCKKHQDDIPLL